MKERYGDYNPAKYDQYLASLRAEHGALESRGGHTNFCKAEPCRTQWLIWFLEAHPPKKAKQK